MKIGMVLDNEYHGDMRVENEIESLTKAGFEVYILCLNYKSKIEPYLGTFGAKVVKVYLPLKVKNKMKGLTNFYVDPYTHFWKKEIKKFVLKYNIDVLHIHDLFLLGAAYGANKDKACKIVADLHENYPEALKYYKFSTTFPGNVLISVPRWKKTEIKWVRKADYIITVIEEAKERVKQLGGKNIHVVANYVNKLAFLNAEAMDEVKPKNNSSFNLFYVGGFEGFKRYHP